MWQDRLRGVQRNHEVWQSLLSVRSLVLPMHQDTHTWLKFASLCRKSARPRYRASPPCTWPLQASAALIYISAHGQKGSSSRPIMCVPAYTLQELSMQQQWRELFPGATAPPVCRQAQRTLRQLLGYDPANVPAGQPGYGSGSGAPDIMFGFLKHMWATHGRQDALARYGTCCLLYIGARVHCGPWHTLPSGSRCKKLYSKDRCACPLSMRPCADWRTWGGR